MSSITYSSAKSGVLLLLARFVRPSQKQLARLISAILDDPIESTNPLQALWMASCHGHLQIMPFAM